MPDSGISNQQGAQQNQSQGCCLRQEPGTDRIITKSFDRTAEYEQKAAKSDNEPTGDAIRMWHRTGTT